MTTYYRVAQRIGHGNLYFSGKLIFAQDVDTCIPISEELVMRALNVDTLVATQYSEHPDKSRLKHAACSTVLRLINIFTTGSLKLMMGVEGGSYHDQSLWLAVEHKWLAWRAADSRPHSRCESWVDRYLILAPGVVSAPVDGLTS